MRNSSYLSSILVEHRLFRGSMYKEREREREKERREECPWLLFTSHTAVFLSVDVGIYTDCIAVCCCWCMYRCVCVCVYLWVWRCVGYVKEQTKPKECTNAWGKLTPCHLFFLLLSLDRHATVQANRADKGWTLPIRDGKMISDHHSPIS